MNEDEMRNRMYSYLEVRLLMKDAYTRGFDRSNEMDLAVISNKPIREITAKSISDDDIKAIQQLIKD